MVECHKDNRGFKEEDYADAHDTVDLVEDADLVTSKKQGNKKPSPSPSSSTTTSSSSAAPPPTTPAVTEINMAGLSARERNMLKRKMKQDAKMNKNKEKYVSWMKEIDSDIDCYFLIEYVLWILKAKQQQRQSKLRRKRMVK